MLDAAPAGARPHLRAELLARLQRARRPRCDQHHGARQRVRPDAPPRPRGRPAVGRAPRRARATRWASPSPPAAPRRRPSSRRSNRPGTLAVRDRHRGAAAAARCTAHAEAVRTAADREARRDPARRTATITHPTPRRARDRGVVADVSPRRAGRRAVPSAGPATAAAYDADGNAHQGAPPDSLAARVSTCPTWSESRSTAWNMSAVTKPSKPVRAGSRGPGRRPAAGRYRPAAEKNMRWSDAGPVVLPTDPLARRPARRSGRSRLPSRPSPPAGPPGCTAPPPNQSVEVPRAEDYLDLLSDARHRRSTRASAGAQIVDGAQSVGRTAPAARRLRPPRTRCVDQIANLVEATHGDPGQLRPELPGAADRGAHHRDAQAPALPAGPASADGRLLPHFVAVANGDVRPGRGTRRQRGGAACPLRGRRVLLAGRPKTPPASRRQGDLSRLSLR